MTAPGGHAHNWVDGTTAITAAKLNEDEADIANVISAHNTLVATVAGKQQLFTQTTTQIANYTANPYEIVKADTSGGTFTITGPTNGTPFGVRWPAGAVSPTVAAPSGYTIAGGATTTLALFASGTTGELMLWEAFGTDYGALGGVKPQLALDARHGTILNTHLLAWAYGQAFRLVSATRDTNEAITTASVVWPDGSTGTFTTDIASSSFPGAIDAYHVTYVPAVGATKTVTQTAVTRDAGGAVTAQPALAIA